MGERATSTFEIKRWDEDSYAEFDGGKKLSRARVTKIFQGDVEGEGAVEYLMMYREDGTATLVGLERIIGRVHGKAGSFVLQEEGTYEGGAAKILWRIVPGSGTGVTPTVYMKASLGWVFCWSNTRTPAGTVARYTEALTWSPARFITA